MTDEIRQHSSSTFTVTVDGTPLPADVEEIMSYAVVEDNLNLPDMFFLSFLDPGASPSTKGGFKIGGRGQDRGASEANPAGEPLFSGEVTALEVEFEGGRHPHGRPGLRPRPTASTGAARPGRSRTSSTPTSSSRWPRRPAWPWAGSTPDRAGPPPHVAQANMTDAEFLTSLAGEVGFVLVVEDGKVNFRPPTDSAEAPGEGDLDAQDPLQLVQGDNLLRLQRHRHRRRAGQGGDRPGLGHHPEEGGGGHAPGRVDQRRGRAQARRAGREVRQPHLRGHRRPLRRGRAGRGGRKALAEQIASTAAHRGRGPGQPAAQGGQGHQPRRGGRAVRGQVHAHRVAATCSTTASTSPTSPPPAATSARCWA